MVRRRRSLARPRVGLALALALVGILALAAPAPAAAPRDHYEFRLEGAFATPLWWNPTLLAPVNEVARFDVGPLPLGVSVKVVARSLVASNGVHLYAMPAGQGPAFPPHYAQDPVPGPEKSVVVAGPGTFTVLVDAATSGPYRIHVAFYGTLGDPATGAPAAFPLTAQSSYRCPLALTSACPP